METLEAVYQRRSIKHFDAKHEMPADIEQKILDATIQSPTSFNIQHWRLVVIKDPKLRQQVRAVGFDQAQITDASLLIIFTGDTKAWEKAPERYWVNAPEEVSKTITGMIAPFYAGKEWLQRDEAQRSIGMAMQTAMLTAKGLGYDSCPMIGFEIEQVAALINLPPDYVMGPMVAIGKRIQDPWDKPGQLSLSEIVKENTF
ncbi:nitroreductase family protein [[Limnothrix rosea] IAM M-220]|uniref:nitroreductase family protein n=1 Tax=[Limnothrix rosea] IAM M-220 TaxID=454133 RepID=UPI0009684CD1|nr:nitroreductase family protein [[Limnothrix rosea] IAM M-220]OKH19578.1 reductase DrgA [[Limnothrix rosea] IAM M-220]